MGTEIAAEFMRAWMARSVDKEPGEEALPSAVRSVRAANSTVRSPPNRRRRRGVITIR